MNLNDVINILETDRHFYDIPRDELKEDFPELHALIGREQRADYHPEGDAFVHTLLVIDRAKKLSSDPVVWFCALTHDFGKAVTVQTKPGSHYNHESLGVPIVRAFCERIEANNYFADAAVLVCREHLNVHRFLQMRGIKKVRFLDRINQHYLSILANTCKADAQGRGPTKENDPYPQADAILDCYLKRALFCDHTEHQIGEMFDKFYPRELIS